MGHLFLQPEQVHLCTGVSTPAADGSRGAAVFVGQLDSEQTPQVCIHRSQQEAFAETGQEVYTGDINESYLHSV